MGPELNDGSGDVLAPPLLDEEGGEQVARVVGEIAHECRRVGVRRAPEALHQLPQAAVSTW